MSKPLLPQAFWFQLAFRCPRVGGMVRTGDEGPLLDLPDSCRLPALAEIDGKTSWVEARTGWNPSGLGIAFRAQGVDKQQLVPGRPEGFATVVVLIDTRDTRDISRASRHCHRYSTRIELKPGRVLEPKVVQKPIPRSTGDPPMSRKESVLARAALEPMGWRFELFFQADALHGFDPETNRRLGFAYRVMDLVRDDQFLGVGKEFPIEDNPSLWSTLELVD